MRNSKPILSAFVILLTCVAFAVWASFTNSSNEKKEVSDEVLQEAKSDAKFIWEGLPTQFSTIF